jgi:hypothetical protein
MHATRQPPAMLQANPKISFYRNYFSVERFEWMAIAV